MTLVDKARRVLAGASVAGAPAETPVVFIGTPNADGRGLAELSRFLLAEERLPGAPRFVHYPSRSSVLTENCNALWCACWNANPRPTHFMLLHSDILPGAGFLPHLLGLMDEYNADVLSAVVALKDKHGMSSHALQFDDRVAGLPERSAQRRRLHLKEAHQLPAAFDAQDVARLWGWDAPHAALLVNTGVVLCRWGEWVKTVLFENLDMVTVDKHERFTHYIEPEDWRFASLAARAGARVMGTAQVPTVHVGIGVYTNQPDWGVWATDEKAPL